MFTYKIPPSQKMSDGGETIRLLALPFNNQPFNAKNSTGRQVCTAVPGTNNQFFDCEVELFDNDTVIQETIDTFGPPGQTTIADRNNFCRTNGSSSGCRNWSKINNQLLGNYCQRIGIGEGGLSGGECPIYNTNLFNPLRPISRGCSKMVTKGVCQNWVEANFGNGGTPSYPNSSIQSYCQNILTPDCACQSAQESAIFEAVSEADGAPSELCWWRPCTDGGESGRFLVRTTEVQTKCPESVCIEVANVFLQNDVIKGKVVIDEASACGSNNGGTPWYRQFWVWLVVLAFVVILFAVILYLFSKA